MPDAISTQTVLLIDDEPELRNLVSQRLEHAGYRVLTAPDGPAGLMVAKTQHPDVILLDIMMPEVDGYQVLRLLKGDHSTADIPVVMLTAKGTERDMSLSIGSGSIRHMVKPFQPKELLDEVKLAMQRHRSAHPHPRVSEKDVDEPH